MRKRARLPSAEGNVIRAIFWPAHVYFIELYKLKTNTYNKVINITSSKPHLFPCGLFFVCSTASLIYFKALPKVNKYMTTLKRAYIFSVLKKELCTIIDTQIKLDYFHYYL